jgi:hypothetical protein
MIKSQCCTSILAFFKDQTTSRSNDYTIAKCAERHKKFAYQ